jgi:hypothetical protein
MIKKYLVLICMVTSLLFIIIASLAYPGGSLTDKNSIGFDWSGNFMSNLFAPKALNGAHNPGRIWAVIGMAFLSVAYGVFFINMSKKISPGFWADTLKYIGFVNIIFVFLIATPLHDVGTISIILTLIGLFTITVLIMKSKLQLLKIACIICLMTYYIFFAFYGLGNLGMAVIMQKLYTICSLLVVLGLEYFTRPEDFLQIKSAKQKIQDTNH